MISARFLSLVGLLALVSAHTTHSTTTKTDVSASNYTPPSSTSTTFITETISTSPTLPSTPPPVPTVSAYGQCGYSGPKICEANTTCTVANNFFSQCIPGPNYVAPPRPTQTTTYTPLPEPTWSYVISFGDSFTDTGFEIGGVKPAIGNQLGNPTWPGLTTAGGKNWVGDILIDNPGLLSYNFASGGATIDASIIAPKIPTARSFTDQVSEFASNLVPAPDYAPWATNNTFFVIWIGNTDITIAYNQSNWSTLLPQIINSYFEQVEILYNAGGRGFIFMMVPDLQHTPAMLLESDADRQAMATAISQFNALLNSKANDLTTKLGGNQFPADAFYMNFAQVVDPGAAFWFGINNPTAYGAPNATCYNPDGVSCLWTDPYSPGQQLQDMISIYAAEVVYLADYQ